MLINPNGIMFGSTSRVDVAGLIASTADISNTDFLAGNYKFSQNPNKNFGIVNNGEISVKDQGLVALVAPGVENNGVMAEFPPTVRGNVAVKPATIALIKEALADVVTKGTATRAKSSLVTIGGKTGTAQTAALRTGPEKDIPKKLRDHAWFVAFAPVEAPRPLPWQSWLSTWGMADRPRPPWPKM